MLMSVGIDIALNPVFIFGIGPIPRLGIAGSALSTLVAQSVTLVALVRHLYKRKHMLCLHADERQMLRIDGTIIGMLIKKGIPMGAQMLVISMSGVLMISLVNSYGVDTAAAYGADMQIWNYIMMPAFAVGMAVSAMAAQNVGAKKWDRVRATARVGVLYSVVLTGSVIVLIELLDKHALVMFLQPGSAALDIGSHINHLATWSFVFFGVSMVLFGVVRATGAVMAPLLILVLTLLGIRFPIAWMLQGQMHADAIWWSFGVSSALAAVLAMVYYKYGGWRTTTMLQTIERSEAQPAVGVVEDQV